jgi:hypothetical protein
MFSSEGRIGGDSEGIVGEVMLLLEDSFERRRIGLESGESKMNDVDGD